MKLKALLFIFTTVSMLYAGCLTDEERNKLIIDGDPKDFEYIPNYIQCDHKKSNLEKFVCNHSDYLLMFHYLSQVNVYKYEDIYKHEVNHHSFNKKSMAYCSTDFKSEPINANHLCFDLKKFTDDEGSDTFPYKLVTVKKHSDYVLQENKHGAVLTDRDGYKVYMGKNCDAEDSKKQKGSWYKEDDQYIIKLGKEKMVFDFPNLNLENYKCVQK
jgi:hypothetical protein